MNTLATIEFIRNLFDCGVFFESLKNSIKVKMEMGAREFLRHLLFGRGYFEMTPPDLAEQMSRHPDLLMVDLRGERKYEAGHIQGTVSHPFDDFLKSILMDGKYRESRQHRLVLVCDTGHKSRVAASVLAGEGFSKVYSLNRGMRRWERWQNLLRFQDRARRSIQDRLRCCAGRKLPDPVSTSGKKG